MEVVVLAFIVVGGEKVRRDDTSRAPDLSLPPSTYRLGRPQTLPDAFALRRAFSLHVSISMYVFTEDRRYCIA
jgi:hypothetical protein